MKFHKLKDRYKVTLFAPHEGGRMSGFQRFTIVSSVKQWCKERLEYEKLRISYKNRRWYVPLSRAGIYAYFKNEDDAVLFLMGYSLPKEV